MTSRGVASVILAVYLTVLALAVTAFAITATQEQAKRPPPFDSSHRRLTGYGQIAFDFAGPEKWASRYRREHARAVDLRAELKQARLELRQTRNAVLARPTVVEAINLAAATYGYGPTLWSKARCETGGTFDPNAHNRSGATGLFQFLPSTWRSTPFAVFSPTSAYANALAAGWMHHVGRGNEWSCR